ncbi:MAG: hypothetical protein MZV70_49085 [Desulfobacterales bacterium]|nr:hypothetical protein [Desulfobacterales bacterium]
MSVLKVNGRLEFKEAFSVNEKGLEGLYKLWVQAAAAEFVRMTRFDPLHSAETEQELYRRLPAVLAALQQEQAATIAIPARNSHYSISLLRAVLLETARPVYDELLAAVHDARRRHAAAGTAAAVRGLAARGAAARHPAHACGRRRTRGWLSCRPVRPRWRCPPCGVS